MWEAPHLRCSDSDRDQAAGILRDSLGDGRITLAELDERLDRVYAAQTYGELTTVMSDLPDWPANMAAAVPAPLAPPPFAQQGPGARRRQGRRFAGVIAACWVVFLLTASMQPGHGVGVLWPLWLMVPWGIAIVTRRGRRRTRRSNPYL